MPSNYGASTIVYVPGIGSTPIPGTAQPLLDHLKALNHKVLYVPSDRRPTHWPPHPTNPSALWRQVCNVRQHMQAQNVTAAIGIGHSLGGIVLLMAACEWPELFTRAICICAPGVYKQGFVPTALRLGYKGGIDVLYGLFGRDSFRRAA